MRIYLADLGHNQLTVSSDTYPLGVANLASYVQAHAAKPSNLEIRIFREPQDLKARMDEAPADILALSNYSWNHNLSRSFARYAKKLCPDTVTVMGGPNFPLTAPEQESLMRQLTEIDVFVDGPTYEGERAFLALVDRMQEAGRQDLRVEPIPANLWMDRDTGQVVRGGEVERIQDLDEIPSPYLAGFLDPFFSSGYLPLMQIARGCPFTCNYCNSAPRSNNKIYSHSLENVKADLEYIAQRVRPEVALAFADDNFGMYPLDLEIADYIAHLQRKYGWPGYIRTTTGKNRGDRIIKVMRTIRGALPMTAAVQSMNPTVLKNIERANIKLDTYVQIQKEVTSQGLQSYGEFILGLPGESKQSFLKGIEDLMDAGVKRVSAHQLMLLHGAPLSNPEYIEKFGLKTKYRIVARNIGNYTGEKIIETERMVYETPDLSFQEWLELRVFHLLLTIYYYEGNFEELFEYMEQNGVKPFDLLMASNKRIPDAPADFANVVQGFVQESQDELFDTPEECVAWAQEHFDGLVSGELGGNLLSKYSMLGRFFTMQAALTFLHETANSLLPQSGSRHPQEELKAVADYLRSVMLHAPFRESLEMTPSWESRYDVDAWRQEHYSQPLSKYRTSEPRFFQTSVDPRKKSLLENRVNTFGEHPSGIGKFTRTMFAQDLRRIAS